MKPKKMVKHLTLSKSTIANLESNEKNAAKGGYWATEINTGCGTWHPACFSRPEWACPFSDGYPRCIITEEVCVISEFC